MTVKRVSFKTRPQHAEWPQLRDFWREADDIAVYDAGWTFDHFQPIFSDRPGPVLEGWVTISALAAETRRLRLGVMVSGVTHRHPAVLANMAATADVISDGRLEIGLGAAWNEEEHDAYGIDFPPVGERMDRLEEACAVVDLLLTQETADFDGVHYRLRDARCEPKPVQTPRPPFVIGGRGERRTLRIVARWADQWNLPVADADVLRHKTEVLRRHCEEVGRDPAEIEISVQVRAGDPDEVAESAASLAEAGAEHIVVWFAAPFRPDDLTSIAEALVDAGIVGDPTGTKVTT